MRIAIVIDSLGKGGAERQAFLMARELACGGCETELIRYYKSPSEFDDLNRTGAKMTLLLKEGRPIRFLWRLASHLRRGRFDVVHAMKEQGCIYGCTAGWLARVPVVIGGYRGQFLSEGLSRRAIGIVKRLATAWIVNSTAVADSIRRGLGIGPEQIHVVHNGIDAAALRSPLSREDARSRLGLPRGAPTVTIVAVLREEKNHAMFLRMATRVHKELPAARFLIVGGTVPGDTTSEPALKKLAVDLGVGDAVLFLGLNQNIPDVLAASDVVALTSRHEGMSNALLEAMAVGIPVVSTAYTGVEEVFHDGVEGFVVDMDDDAALADRVRRLLTDDALRERMGEAARERVRTRFSLEAMTRDLIEVYQCHLRAALRGPSAAGAGGGSAVDA